MFKLKIILRKKLFSGWLEWGPLSACSVTCDYGVQARLRNCSTGNNVDCTGGKNYDLRVCNAGTCGSM